MVRITTNSVMSSYKSSLMRSGNQLELTRQRVLTQRKFNSYAEDPAAANQAFKLRRLFSQNADHLSNNQTLISKFEAAFTAVGSVKTSVSDAIKDIANRGSSGSTGSGREPLGEVLESKAQAIVQTLNARYGDSFIFSGSKSDSVPFSWSSDGGLLFQGIPVDTGDGPTRPKGTPPDPSDPGISAEWATYYDNNSDFKKLAQMSHENTSVDIGLGMSEAKDGTLNKATVFNGALSALNILGFGRDADGDPKNAASLIKELSNIYKNSNPDTGEYAPGDEEKADRILKKLEAALAETTNQYVNIDGKTQFIKENKGRLDDVATTVNEQILDLEQVNMADAITDFIWAQYCYNSALKVGNSILSQSLIDYMN